MIKSILLLCLIGLAVADRYRSGDGYRRSDADDRKDRARDLLTAIPKNNRIQQSQESAGVNQGGSSSTQQQDEKSSSGQQDERAYREYQDRGARGYKEGGSGRGSRGGSSSRYQVQGSRSRVGGYKSGGSPPRDYQQKDREYQQRDSGENYRSSYGRSDREERSRDQSRGSRYQEAREDYRSGGYRRDDGVDKFLSSIPTLGRDRYPQDGSQRVPTGTVQTAAISQNYTAPKPYNYGYEVEDGYGNINFRKEDSDGGVEGVRGSYGYRNPKDGTYRVVEYIANTDGYRAVVKTNEPGTSDQDPSDASIFTEDNKDSREDNGYRGMSYDDNRQDGYRGRSYDEGYRSRY